MCPLSGHEEGVAKVKGRLLLPISIVISPVVDRLQECGKKQGVAEELFQSQSRFNEEQLRDCRKIQREILIV